MKKQNKKGFTLVELLVVIAILAILATVSVVGYSQFTEKAKKSNDETELHQYTTLIEAQLMDGEEIIKGICDSTTEGHTHSADCATTITFSNGEVKGLTDANKDYVVKALIGETDLTKLKTGGTMTVEVTTTKLTVKYYHNLTETNAVTWSIGK